jgi:hypothetical protein
MSISGQFVCIKCNLTINTGNKSALLITCGTHMIEGCCFLRSMTRIQFEQNNVSRIFQFHIIRLNCTHLLYKNCFLPSYHSSHLSFSLMVVVLSSEILNQRSPQTNKTASSSFFCTSPYKLCSKNILTDRSSSLFC